MSSSYEDDICRLPEQDFVWDMNSELALYQALVMHKPAGINKHFNVALVSEALSQELGRPVLACSIWKKLREMFDLKAVEDREESLPFSLEVKDFRLPRKDFEILIFERSRDWEEKGGTRHYFSRTPTTPKSEGSEPRSSPIHRYLDLENSDDEDDEDVDSDLERSFDEEEEDDEDDDDNFDHCELESNKSDRLEEDDFKEADKEKEMLIAQAREELEKKLKERTREEDKDRIKTTPKSSRHEAKTAVREDERVSTKRHITRSTPSSTPNKRRK